MQRYTNAMKLRGQKESRIIQGIHEVLVKHPFVRYRRRLNSGVANMSGRRVAFNTVFGLGCENLLSLDFDGMLHGGRYFAIEAKPEDWRGPGGGNTKTAKREQDQAATIEWINECGGLAAFVTDPEQVNRLLNDAQREEWSNTA